MTHPAIREIEAAKTDAVLALWRACGLTRPWNDPDADLRLARTTPISTVLVAMDADRLTGSIMVGFDGHRGWVYYLAVDPAARRRGLGRTLMTAAEHWLRERGAPKLQLMVRDTNTEALGFYAALGMEVQSVTVLGRRLDEV